MKKILVPTDFTPIADKALDFAVQIAKQAKAEIYLTHTSELLNSNLKDNQSLKKDHKKGLDNPASKNQTLLANRIQETWPITIHTKIYNGNVPDSILKAAEESEADMIIIGTRGETKFTERIFGSTTSDILGKPKVPVVIVSPLTKWYTTSKLTSATTREEGEKFTLDTILFATNHFEKNTDLLNPIVDVAKLFASTVHVAVFLDTDFAKAYDYIYNGTELNRYIDFLQRTYPDVSFKGELLEGADFESTLEKYNEENAIDIIAMITYPKSFWDRLLKKSVTKEVAFNSKVPVIAISGR
jgi:nucleotide-binding universal stress UspA family protein